MSANEGDLTSWTRREWVGLTVLVLAAQVALMVWLLDDGVTSLPHGGRHRRVRFRTVDPATSLADTNSLLSDPTLFALVTPRSFSDKAWLTIPEFAYALTNAPAQPTWFVYDKEDLADDFAEFVETNIVTEGSWSVRLRPVYTQIPQTVAQFAPGTALIQLGGVAGRQLQSGELPRQTEPILTNTVVRITVDPSGAIVSSALLTNSGFAKADQDALNFTRKARFAPIAARKEGTMAELGLDIGTLIFQWYSVNWTNLPPWERR